MEDYKLDIMIDSGPSARSIQIELKPFTLIGATTRAGLLSAPLRSRFGISNRLDYYQASALKMIVERSARLIQINIDDEGALELPGVHAERHASPIGCCTVPEISRKSKEMELLREKSHL